MGARTLDTVNLLFLYVRRIKLFASAVGPLFMENIALHFCCWDLGMLVIISLIGV